MNSLMETVAYGVLDAATGGRGIRRRIGGEWVRLPVRWSRFYPADLDPAVFAMLRRHCRPGDVAMDLGAHLGVFSVVMSRLVGPSGRVYCFEPTDRARLALEKTLRLNGCSGNTEVRSEAVGGDTTPVARFYDAGDPLSSANGLIRTAAARATTVVPTVTVDDFIARRGISTQFLRINVEGAELDVLRGAEQTIMNCRPSALLSLHPQVARQDGAGLAEVWDLLHAYQMSVLWRGQRLNRREFRQNEEDFEVEVVPNETLPPYDPQG